jgi:cholesterol transport system auxiliary component
MKPVPTLAGVVLALALAGCAGLTSRDVATVRYVLRPPAVSAPVAAGGVTAGADRLAATSLKVVRVVPQPGYSGDHILLLGDDHSLGFFAASRWVDTLPAIVGTLAAESMRDTGRLQAVHDENAPFAADYTLRLTIRRFDAQYAAAGQAPRVTVGLECAIGRRTDRGTVASFAVEGQAVAAADRMRDVVAAFERAAQQALAEAVRRTLGTLETDVATLPAAPAAATGATGPASRS